MSGKWRRAGFTGPVGPRQGFRGEDPVEIGRPDYESAKRARTAPHKNPTII